MLENSVVPKKKSPKSHTKTDLSIVLKFETIIFKKVNIIIINGEKKFIVFVFFKRIIIDTVLRNEIL